MRLNQYYIILDFELIASNLSNSYISSLRFPQDEQFTCLISIIGQGNDSPIYINNFNSHMNSLEEFIDDIWKSIHSLSQFHLNLYQMSNLKVLNRQELSQNPYIADQLKLYRAELVPIKEEIQIICERIKEAIEVLAVGKERQQSQREDNLLIRLVSRAIEVSSSASIEQDNAYYQFYNYKFKSKCARVINDINEWQIFEVIKIIYKYFRHVVLIQLERYEEILECLTQNDFQSLYKFKDYFYDVLHKKENKKENILKDSLTSLIPPPRDTLTPPVSEQTTSQKVSPPTKFILQIEQSHDQVHLKPVSLQCIPQEHTVPNQVVIIEPILSQSCPMIDSVPGYVPSKRRQQNKSTKKLFFLLGPVMGIKKQHFISQHANKSEEASMLTELVSRNKANHKQINEYFSYAQQMEKHLSLNHSADFYYYREEPSLFPMSNEKSATQKKRIRVSIPLSQRESIFASQENKKSEALLAVNLEKPRYHRTIHKSVFCRGKVQPNAEAKELIEQKPLKIDSDFLEINLRKVLPTRRQSQFDHLVSRASSLGTFKHEIYTRRIQPASENMDKGSSEVFRSVKILHQGQFNAEKEAKIHREREKHHQHDHQNRIQNRIKEELKGEHMEGRPQDLKKIWRDQLTFKKLELG